MLLIHLLLFWSMVQIGLFSIGGGYAALPLIQHQIVDLHGWISDTMFADIISIAEMTPGPIAINAATFVGIIVGGYQGALTATLGCVLPSFVIVTILAKIYYKYRNLDTIQHVLGGLRPAVVAMIASAGLTIVILAIFKNHIPSLSFDNINLASCAILCISLVILRNWKLNPLYIMALSALAGMFIQFAS